MNHDRQEEEKPQKGKGRRSIKKRIKQGQTKERQKKTANGLLTPPQSEEN